MCAGIARIKGSALAALPATSGTDFRPQVRCTVHRVILEARTVRQAKFPELLEVLDREHALALPSAPKEDLSVHEFLEMVGKRGLRNADRGLELPERPLAEEQEFEHDLPRHILPQDGEYPPLGLHERTGDDLP